MTAKTDAAVARPRRRRRRIAIIGGIAVAVVAAVVVLMVHPWSTATDAAAQSRTVTAARTTLQQTVGATGTIEPAQQANLSFTSAGTVNGVDVQVGQTVKAGQALASIDPTSLQDAVAVAQAQVTQAQAAVDAGGSSAQQAQSAAQLSSAQAQLSQAKNALVAATLTSPIASIVAAVNVSVGTQVGSGSTSSSSSSSGGNGGSGGSFAGSNATASGGGSSTGSSSADVSVISTSSWIVNATVSSTDLPSLKTGMQAQITPTGATQAVFGTVQSVGVVAGSSTTGASQFPVTITVTGSPKGLYAGTSATVSITVKQLQNVLAVPTLALHTANGKTTVTVVKGGKDVTTTITTGGVFGAQTQVVSGLSAGDEVLLPTFIRPAGTTGGTGTGAAGGFGGAGFGGAGGRTFGGRSTGGGAQ